MGARRARINPAVSLKLPQQALLQQLAYGNVRLHAVRSALRVMVLLIVDSACIAVALGVAIALRPGTEIGFYGLSTLSLHAFEVPSALLAGLFLAGNYRAGDRRRHPPSIVAGIGLGLMLLFWHPLWENFAGSAFEWLVATAWIGLVTVGGRLVANRIVRRRRATDPGIRRVLLVGQLADIQQTLSRFSELYPAAVKPIGFVHAGTKASTNSLGDVAALGTVIHSHHINTVLLCGRLDDSLLTEVIRCADAAGCVVTSQSRPYSLNGLEPHVVWHEGTPHIELTRPGLRGNHLVLKRFFDLAAATLGLVLLSPIFLLVATLVRLTSPGPVFFQQTRIGYGGRPFLMYKFRTMCVDAESQLAALAAQSAYQDPRLFKMARDPRITTCGKWLRRTSLDELPQLWNVIRGSMSLVGPRPPVEREVALYEEKSYARFDMKPGITGPWQVSGRNRITSFDEVIRIETRYMHGWTIWRDLYILLRTVPAVLRMDGAQ